MDFLDTQMELLNNTSSPPINIANHQLSNPRESPSLLNSSGVMEPNNLSQSALDVTASAQMAGATVAAPQSFSERNLDLKLPLLSSSSSDSESESATNPTADTSAIGDGERASSPPPICAICLGRCKNKCFTDSCMHQFCFKCLGEWSKVKPECPLCKQNFKSIIHNVKSIHQFEEYHVQPPTVQIAHPPFEMDFQEMRIFGVVHPGHNRNHIWNESIPRPLFYSDFSSASPYSSSSTAGSISSASGSANRSISLSGNGSRLRNQYVYRGELLDLYRQDNPGAIANSGTLSQLWRRYVYDRKLYAMPVADITGRFRESSARFYRDNPSQIHRLMPWINRDVVCLLRQTQHDVSTVLESINSALTLMNILSPAFRRRLQPYLGTKTAHFIHELNNFARSPFDMIGYDRAVQYSAQTNNEEIVIEFTSSDESTDNEHIDLVRDGSGGINNNNTTSSRTTNASINAINLTIHNRLSSASANAAGNNRGISNANNSGNVDIPDDVSLVIDLRGESDNNETASTGQATANSSNYQNGQNGGTSDGGNIIVSSAQPTVSENIELTSGSSDECEFILERKPPHLRTPEMVSLDSASDSDVVFVDESKPSNKTSFSSSEDDHNENAIRNTQNHHHTTRPSTSISTRSKITALVEAKKRNHSDNLVKSEQQDAQTEIYNVGASTSAALRLSLQKRVDKSNRSEGGGTRRLRRSKYSLRNTEHQVPRRRGKHLDSESSHSSTSSSSTTSYSSFSDTSLSDSSTSSSDEEYVANLSRRRKTSSAVADSSHKRCKLRKTKNRKANDNNSYSRAKRVGKKRKISNYDYSTDDEDNGHIGKNFALVMAISERLKRQSKIKHSRKSSTHSKERKVEDNDGSEGENSWRLKAVNEPLRKRQQQRIKSSHKRDERKRQRKTSTYKHRKHYSDTNREGDGEGRNTRKRLKIDASAMSDLGTEETSKINRFDYGSSSDESDNINLIQLKTKLTAQDQQNKNGNMDSRNMNTHTTQNSNETESLVETNLELETLDTNNINNSNDIAVTVTEATTTTVTTISEENSETHKPIPTTNTIMETNEKLDNLPSTSQTVVVTTISASATIDKENNFIEPMVKNDLHNSSEDSNDDDDDNGNNNNNGNDYNVNNDNQVVNAGDQQQPVISSSMSNYVDENNHNQNCTNTENPHHYRNNVSDDDDDYDDYDDGETSNNIPGKTNLNESNVFGDGTSMSTTTTDTILHEGAEQISSVAVNFYNPQQSFNTGEFADENSANTSSSNSSILSSTSSTSSSSSISSSCNTNVFMNFKDL